MKKVVAKFDKIATIFHVYGDNNGGLLFFAELGLFRMKIRREKRLTACLAGITINENPLIARHRPICKSSSDLPSHLSVAI